MFAFERERQTNRERDREIERNTDSKENNKTKREGLLTAVCIPARFPFKS